jgi:nitroimidazol reductase NimA-like FMN-containing flavoprotein (pyridoxamine 5'-phosphate oxidase superfamily)
MIHDMRRIDREVSNTDAREIMARADHGFLATVSEDGSPYAVPMNHVLEGDRIYLHCALSGHKLDNLAHENRVAYAAVASSRIIPEQVTTHYESAIAFGHASIVEDPAEKRRALDLLGRRFCASFPAQVEEEIRKDGPKTVVIRIQLERITGKVNRPA